MSEEKGVLSETTMKEFDIHAAFENEGYISSIDLLNNIIATTNTKNVVKIYDINEKKEKLTYNVEDIVINDIKLLKNFLNDNSETCSDFVVKECLFSAYENSKKCKIYHFNILNKKVIHIFPFTSEIVDNSFALHPNTHIFIVTLKCKELLVYHIRDQRIIYKTNVQNENCVASYNKTGIIYAYTVNEDMIYLCSCFGDDYNDEYFANFDISKLTNNDNSCTHIDFSFDEKKMLIATKFSYIYTLDAYTGEVLYSYNFQYENVPSLSSPLLAYPVYSFDSNYVISGGKDGYLHMWDVRGNFICKKKIDNNVLFVKWVYNRVAFITTSNYLLIWQAPKKV
ncbi:WD repeat-containing protein, putative [Plasmodium ovale wallikeri]|uniref:WD repeat-containing protein, putative n=2 Tax=Plasmodium ovale TaxID=36330 RepID=A0A1A8ZCA8_PLAOA|nr:WD repeat-containing protein, putative [Plasmodium ovale wallikeri]SBT41622.1 WD repeat-containing protein, putative [Plasmodium ovale wallikeri]SBT78159.1 WD repeat-containing protein, putative [Plasmodium ovale]